ncbi:MAG: arylamine N-acetyltransferase [Litorimonas sp.]
MRFQNYLSRIGLDQAPRASLDALHLLQDAHMRHVPFENLDVLIGRPLDLSPEALFEKIVSRSRGGYCFELNTLYGALLSEVGFDPVPMLARVWLRDPVETPPRTHLVNRVSIDGQDWISDVGFGGRAARYPLKIEDGYEVDDGDGRIRIIKDAEFGYRISRFQDGVWSDQYTVETEAAHMADILSGNHWTEYHPESHFRHGIGVGLFTVEGRTSFYGGVLTHRGEETVSSPVSGLEDALEILKAKFGIAINTSQEERARLERFAL